MQQRFLTQVLPRLAAVTVSSLLTLGISLNEPSYARGNKFFCTQEENVPVTKVRGSRGAETFLRWVVKDFKNFPPQKRCQIVTAKLQRYYDQGKLFFTGRKKFNGYPVVCIANKEGAPCTVDNLLVTLKPGTDFEEVLVRMTDFRRGAGDSPINLSGCNLISYNDEGNIYIDVKKLLDNETCTDN
ncbi:COP23 domain-containing protein [Dolichospermum sp. UHCC 0684]|uniref:Uncharacterized protein n=1 Tax=Dolichospermum flos-aquae CCAP 1403/13F TaxID=315271 RepID=A0A6H2BVS7_DOLFA|nr:MULTISPECIES: COP23 domain-containing protein [Dolichospermum]MEA5530428.1 COP23 domain-containing protein [Dolichospermum sp. UHCC 0684]MTJ33708.1 hypothetical protein [Dolichospermum sp. UHCC 0260]QJB43066.1 hypothetical protein HGD76_01265 [Dolichospermum flos-aquae CCAP 1403/13F]